MIPLPRQSPLTVVAGHGLVRLAGELDVATAPAVRDAVRQSLDSHPALLRIDISGVSFCDCSGLRALLWAKAEAARAEAGFHLSGPLQPVVARVLDATATTAHLGLTPRPAERGPRRREQRRRAAASGIARHFGNGVAAQVVAR
ncbi:STAS domain-containing protein [Streptomyces sp. NPDC006544]|uniref:STAS domain-containing protein n=1 Tax=Streptomyces sp. NPDC006544 TaxID=3154583 RepID=UPI0033B8E83A